MFSPTTIPLKTLYSCILGALASSLSIAQESPLGSDFEEIIVTANRSAKPLSQIPNTVTLIGEEDLRQQISVNNDMATILGNMIPSFSPSRQKMTGYGESLRGRDPLYMVDGVPQSNPLRDGSRDGHTIDPLMLERVEVIHGANAIHGMGASGGIINLITRRPTQTWQQSIRVESLVQEEDLRNSLGYGANYSLSGRTGNFDLLLSAGYRSSGVNYDANGTLVGFDNTQGDTMDSTTANLFLKTGYDWGDQRLELSVNDYSLRGNSEWVSVSGDYANGVPTTAAKGKVLGKEVSNEISLISVVYSKDELLGHGLRVQVFDQSFAGTFGGGTFGTFADPEFGGAVFDQSQNNSNKQGVKLTLVKDDIAQLPLSVVYGADFLKDETYQALVQTGRNWVPETSYANLAVFAQLEFTGIDRLTLTSGARAEESVLKVDDFTTLYSYNGGQFVRGGEPEFSDTLFNVGGTYAISEQWRVFANYSEGFSMPDVGRVLRGINQPGQEVENFLNLEPLITENQELGLEYRAQSFNAQLSYYTSESAFGQRLQVNADGIYSVQRERTEVEGFELRGQWIMSDRDTLDLRYALTQGEYDSDDDGRVDTDLGGANMSPDRANLSWERVWTPAFNTRLQFSFLQDRSFKNKAGATTVSFDGYVTVDLYGEYSLGGGALRLGIQNLGNEDYYTYYSQTLGSDDRNFKGIGRSASLSYSLQF